MKLLDADDDTLRDRMERSPEQVLAEVRRIQTELSRLRGIEFRAQRMACEPPLTGPTTPRQGIRASAALDILGGIPGLDW